MANGRQWTFIQEGIKKDSKNIDSSFLISSHEGSKNKPISVKGPDSPFQDKFIVDVNPFLQNRMRIDMSRIMKNKIRMDTDQIKEKYRTVETAQILVVLSYTTK